MARVEVDDSELQQLRGISGVVQKIMTNPETRRAMLQAQKKVMPDVRIAELETAEVVNVEMETLNKKISELHAKLDEDKTAREGEIARRKLEKAWNSGRSKLRSQGWNDDGLEAVEKFMEERGVADHEIAAAAFEKLHPAASTTRPGGDARFDIFNPANRGDGNDLKLLFEGRDEDFLNTVVPKALADVRGR